MQPDISLILPAYNEAGCIAGTIAEAVSYFESRRIGYEILVAADGDDGTREIVAELGREAPAILALSARQSGWRPAPSSALPTPIIKSPSTSTTRSRHF
jgi:glycosyltransferase involved in cell wall biosynthesis